jgi:GntR family transcriptional regulator
MNPMQLTIDTADRRPIETQIVDEVRRALVLGTLRPDDPLPPVRELAADLRVNPGAVARAYQMLESLGVVRMVWGRGPVIARPAEPDDDRAPIVKRVAERALRDARRHGVSPGELVDAIRAAADGAVSERSSEPSAPRSEQPSGRAADPSPEPPQH